MFEKGAVTVQQIDASALYDRQHVGSPRVQGHRKRKEDLDCRAKGDACKERSRRTQDHAKTENECGGDNEDDGPVMPGSDDELEDLQWEEDSDDETEARECSPDPIPSHSGNTPGSLLSLMSTICSKIPPSHPRVIPVSHISHSRAIPT